MQEVQRRLVCNLPRFKVDQCIQHPMTTVDFAHKRPKADLAQVMAMPAVATTTTERLP